MKKKLNGKSKNYYSQKDIDNLIHLINKSKKPIIYSGGGVINSGPEASEALREFVQSTGFPITSTLQGLGAYPGDDNQFLGMLGMHGTYEANNAMHDCDLLINIGARFDDRITGKIDEFSPKSKKVHIDIDPSSINKIIKVDLALVGDVKEVLKSINKTFKKKIMILKNQISKIFPIGGNKFKNGEQKIHYILKIVMKQLNLNTLFNDFMNSLKIMMYL